MDFIVFCCLCPRIAFFCPRVSHGANIVQPRSGLFFLGRGVVIFLCPRVAHGATAVQPRSGLLIAILLKIIYLNSEAAGEAIFYGLVAVLGFYVGFDARNAIG